MCFSFQASITVLGFYFTRRRALANALASMGVSLGIMLWPLLSGYLLEDLGWRGTFLIFGGVFLHCCVCGAIVRPVATSMAPETKEGSPPPSKTPAPSCLAACGRAIQRHLAFDILWHNAVYRMYTLGVMWMIVGFPLPHVFLVPYAIRHGVDEHRAALLISIIGFCNIFLRPMAGLAAGRRDFADRSLSSASLPKSPDSSSTRAHFSGAALESSHPPLSSWTTLPTPWRGSGLHTHFPVLPAHTLESSHIGLICSPTATACAFLFHPPPTCPPFTS